MLTIKVFHHIEELDAFLVTPEFTAISERLGLAEWTPVVWIGRLFMLDNDYGEHWFDNWDERDALEAQAASLGINNYDLMIFTPDRFQNGQDGPCHSDKIRKAFWTDVLKSLALSYDLLFEAAREHNERIKQLSPITDSTGRLVLEAIPDLEERIAGIQASIV